LNKWTFGGCLINIIAGSGIGIGVTMNEPLTTIIGGALAVIGTLMVLGCEN